MTKYFPGPYEVRIPYTTDGLEHTKKINCIVSNGPVTPGADPTTVELVTRGGSQDLKAAVDGYLAAITPILSSATTLGSFELWHYPVAGAQPVFVTGGVTAATAGAGAAYVPAQQLTLTFRSGLGNIMRDVILEPVTPGNTRQRLTANAGNIGAISTYWLSANGWAIARDDSFPIAPLNYSLGQNEQVFEERFR